VAKAKPAADSDDSSDDAPAPKAKAVAKAKPAADSDDSSDDAPAPKAKAVAKAKPAADSDDSSDDAPAPKAKAVAKAKPAADSDDSSDEPGTSDLEPLGAKAAAKAAADDDSSDEDVEMKPAQEMKKKIDVDGAGKNGGSDELTVFIGGLSFSLDENTVRKDFTDCGEIASLKMPTNEDGRLKGFAFVTFTTKAGVDAALKFNGESYGGRSLTVNLAGDKSGGKDGKGKGKDGKSKGKDGKDGGKGAKGNQELTAFIRGLPFSTEDAVLRKDFEECGEIVSFKVLKNEEGACKGMAFIEYKTQEGFEAACKFDGDTYGGRQINVAKAGDSGGKGKDGKDKGKGKGKDKGKKGKDKAKAANSGAIVESTGEKKTFGDSDESDA